MNMGSKSGAFSEDHTSIRVKLPVTMVLQGRPIDLDGSALIDHTFTNELVDSSHLSVSIVSEIVGELLNVEESQ